MTFESWVMTQGSLNSRFGADHEPLRTQQTGCVSRHAVEDALGGLIDLRNRTMHPVRLLLTRIPGIWCGCSETATRRARFCDVGSRYERL